MCGDAVRPDYGISLPFAGALHQFSDMRHLAVLKDAPHTTPLHVARAAGRYYTSRRISDHLTGAVWKALSRDLSANATVRVCDPFAGDGRLVNWLIERVLRDGRHDLSWDITLWDIYEPGLTYAKEMLYSLAEEKHIRLTVHADTCDAIMMALQYEAAFDVVVTNPPWENLKPDRRELDCLPESARESYIAALREYDILLGMSYPLSQPERKFAGWGTNLARVGVEVALRLAATDAVVGIVSPASLLADDSSAALRRWMLTQHTLLDAAYIPAEARQFEGADVSTAVVVLRRAESARVAPRVTVYDSRMHPDSASEVHHPSEFLRRTGYVIPISFGLGRIDVLLRLSHLPTWGDLEKEDLWAGRELDETGIDRWLSAEGTALFVKGRMVQRFAITELPTRFISRPGWRVPASVTFERIAWRDVSRPSQKRRIIATIIPPGWVAGNSLGVAHFRDADATRLRALLGVMSSLVFEFQLRCFLATGHVSLSALRKVHVPNLFSSDRAQKLAIAVDNLIAGVPRADTQLEAVVAHAYGLTSAEFGQIMASFSGVSSKHREEALRVHDTLLTAELHS